MGIVQIAGAMVVVIVAETAMVTYAATLVSIGVIVWQQRRQWRSNEGQPTTSTS